MEHPSRSLHEPHTESPLGRFRRGVVTLIQGCMFSGKTTELLRRIDAQAPETVIAIKHVVDTRYSGAQIVSHAGKAHSAIAVHRSDDILAVVRPSTRIVAIDEAHFFDDDLLDTIATLADHGIDVVLTSLEPDSWGRPFPINHRLRSTGAEVVALFCFCARCGGRADRTQRLTPVVNGNMIVEPQNYEPRCEKCWKPPLDAEMRMANREGQRLA